MLVNCALLAQTITRINLLNEYFEIKDAAILTGPYILFKIHEIKLICHAKFNITFA